MYKHTHKSIATPFTFIQGESEYHRSYKPLDGSDEQLAGLSSAKLAVTQEPAFARKRKPPDHGRKVTFITDYTEHGAPLVSGVSFVCADVRMCVLKRGRVLCCVTHS